MISLRGSITLGGNIAGTFAIQFTSYVDAIENSSDFDNDPERRRPPSSGYHINHFQQGSAGDIYLDGDIITTGGVDFELDVETTTWGANATHYTVDDFPQVRNKIKTSLKANIGR